MSASQLRAVIFDIGRVLVKVDVARAIAGLSQGVSLSPQELWNAIENDPRWSDWQEGRISPEDWHFHLGNRLGGSLTFEQFKQVWNSALVAEPIQPEPFLEKLSGNYRLALLSNTDPMHMSEAEARFPFFRFFPVRIYSFRVGASKPNPFIYAEALRACKVRAEEAIFIDDVPAYAQAAQRLGMTGLVFRSHQELQTNLRDLGVKVD